MIGIFPSTSMPDRDWWSALWPDPEGVLGLIGVRTGMSVLDLCCGDGYFTAPLARIAGGRVYALDLDPAMIEQARAEVEGQGATDIEWICADAGEIASRIAEKLDYVLIANTFHGVPDQLRLSRAVAEVVKAGGSFGIVNWHELQRENTTVLGVPRGPRTEMRMSPKATQNAVEPSGLRLSRVIELPPYHYAVIFSA